LGIFGFILVAKIAWEIALYLFQSRTGIPASFYIQKGGRWALVTGCTDGIGEAYAFEAARLGFNVLLVSRTQSKLDETEKAIMTKYPTIETKTVAFDFTTKSPEAWQRISDLVARYPVGLLVNNVGINVDCPTTFLDHSVQKMDDIVQVNISALNRMCHLFLPSMVERKAGAIVNLSSFTGRMPTPMLSVYSATKAYDDFFSHALNAEYREFGITVQSVTPFFVASSMSGMRSGGIVASAPAVARQSLARLGQTRTAPHWIHHLIIEVGLLIPNFLRSRIMLKENKKTRASWERKQARLAAQK